MTTHVIIPITIPVPIYFICFVKEARLELATPFRITQQICGSLLKPLYQFAYSFS